MYKLYESRQIGELVYMTKNIESICSIIIANAIRASTNKEKKVDGTLNSNYVSFSRGRHTLAAYRNPSRWVYGLILDGNSLSNRYSFLPYNYAGSNDIKLRLKTLTHYDNNTYKVNFVHYAPIRIGLESYEYLRGFIESAGDTFNTNKRLKHTTGKRKVHGAMIVDKYEYALEMGGIVFRYSALPHYLLTDLRKMFDESEERVWLNRNDKKSEEKVCVHDSLLRFKYNEVIGFLLPKEYNTVAKFINLISEKCEDSTARIMSKFIEDNHIEIINY